MNKKINLRSGLATGAIVAILGGVIVLGAIVFWMNSDDPSGPEASEKGVMVDEGGMMKEEEKTMMTEGEEGMMEYKGEVLAGTNARILDFYKADYDQALVSNKLVVLYFYANWCPICKVEFPKMQLAFDEIKSDEVVAFRVNYRDSETDKDEEALAKEFGVAYQHTKVFLKGGERVLKAPDSWEKERYLSEINKFLVIN